MFTNLMLTPFLFNIFFCSTPPCFPPPFSDLFPITPHQSHYTLPFPSSSAHLYPSPFIIIFLS